MRIGGEIIYAVELRTDDNQSIWKLDIKDPEDDFTDEFVDGILYGCLFVLKEIPGHHVVIMYRELGKAGVYEKQIRSVEDIYDLNGVFKVLHKDIRPTGIKSYDVYVVLLKDVDHDGKANEVHVYPPFFQGLFTALNIIQMPYDKVVLHKPIMRSVAFSGIVNTVNYNIRGLNLPDLEDIIRR